MTTVFHDDKRIATLPGVAQRFLRYVRIDTRSNPDSASTPSTEGQLHLGRLLCTELRELGLSDVQMDNKGYVYATLPAVDAAAAPCIGLLAHLDTSPDEPGEVRPLVHFDYEGGVVALNGGARLDPSTQPALRRHAGEDLITSDGTSLLGSDDKAGVAVLMQLAEAAAHGGVRPRPKIQLCFTVDEEIGRGVDHLDRRRFDADVAYTIDGGGVDAVYAETFNASEAIVQIDGIMVHPGYAEGIMVNAGRILAHFLARLPEHEAPETTSGREGYIHPHRIEASDAARARATLILRDFTEEGLSARKSALDAIAENLRRQHPRARIHVEHRDQYRNMRTYIDNTDPRVLSFAHDAARSMGMSLQELLVRGGTDGARLSELGIPTPNIFNGGYDFHSRFEWNTVQNLERSLAYVTALVRVWGAHGGDTR